MIVFVEYVVIDNFFIDYFLLKVSLFFSALSYKKYRLILSSLLGAIFSLIFPLIELSGVRLVLIKIAFGLIITFSCCKYNSIYSYLKTTAIFFAFTFFVGGAIMGLGNIFGINVSSEISIALMVLPIYLMVKFAIKVVSSIVKNKSRERFFYDVSICAFNITIKMKGFLDSGNNAKINEYPVVFINRNIYYKLLEGTREIPKLQRVKFSTVGGIVENICFKCDALTIYFSDKENKYNNVMVAVSRQKLNCDILLHCDLINNKIKEGQDEENIKTIKEVS